MAQKKSFFSPSNNKTELVILFKLPYRTPVTANGLGNTKQSTFMEHFSSLLCTKAVSHMHYLANIKMTHCTVVEAATLHPPVSS